MLCLILLAFAWFEVQAVSIAKEESENVSVTIPSNISIVFNEDGTNTIGTCEIINQSQLPVEIFKINITECNDWKLVNQDTTICKDEKQVCLEFDSYMLKAGENTVNVRIPEESRKEIRLEVKRGAWTSDRAPEQAFLLEMEYSFGTREFLLSYDTNGGDEQIESVRINNGESIKLPVLSRFGYDFDGWLDEQGNLYNDMFVMTVGDCKLNAQWTKTEAYAIFSMEDKTLRFIRSATVPKEGDIYQNVMITNVYGGIETSNYSEWMEVPWLRPEASYGSNIQRVIVEDWIRPISTAQWFFCCHNCAYLDVAKIDTSQVVNMCNTFSATGDQVTETVTLIGISEWDTSKVTNMGTMFRYLGRRAKVLIVDDISGWDTSQVKDMLYMFFYAGENAEWSLNLSSWNVRNVEINTGFCNGCKDKIKEPNW